LVDGGDPQLRGDLRVHDLDLAALERVLAGVRRQGARDRLDQRRLAGAVVADEREHLAGVDVEVDPGERVDRTEALAHAAQAQQRGHAGHRAAVAPVQTFAFVVKPSLKTVETMLSLVTATGSSSTDGTLPAPLSTVVVVSALIDWPRPSAIASSAARSASAL